MEIKDIRNTFIAGAGAHVSALIALDTIGSAIELPYAPTIYIPATLTWGTAAHAAILYGTAVAAYRIAMNSFDKANLFSPIPRKLAGYAIFNLTFLAQAGVISVFSGISYGPILGMGVMGLAAIGAANIWSSIFLSEHNIN